MALNRNRCIIKTGKFSAIQIFLFVPSLMVVATILFVCKGIKFLSPLVGENAGGGDAPGELLDALNLVRFLRAAEEWSGTSGAPCVSLPTSQSP